MNKCIVIGVLGRAGSGKSTAAKHIQEKYGAKVFSFAKPLKNLAKILFNFTDEQVFGTQAQKETVDLRYGISPRTAMIRLGDGARETLWKSIWIDTCFTQIQEDYEAYVRRPNWPNEFKTTPIYIIEDARYPNEVKAISSDKRFSGYVIKLVCPDSDSSPEYANASSEKSVDECAAEDIYSLIVSSKSPGSVDLKDKIDKVIDDVLSRVIKPEGSFDSHPY